MSSPLRQGPSPSSSASVHDTCQLLEKTLSSLVADAAVLRQLSALKHEIAANHNNESGKDMGRQLRRIDRVVSELEEKMQIFRDVVQEEQKAIAEIEACAEETAAQVAEYQQALQQQRDESGITEGMKRTTMRDDPFEDDDQRYVTYRDDDFSPGTDNAQDHVPHDNHHHNFKNPEHEDNTNNLEQHFIQLDLVSLDEFRRVPRSTRAHISRALVNEAVLDIERVFQEKEMQRLKNRRKRALTKWGSTSAVDDDDDVLTCSEQEMRQSCAFFRSGESSARGVLQILRHLHRIKQLPSSGNGQKIVYTLP